MAVSKKMVPLLHIYMLLEPKISYGIRAISIGLVPRTIALVICHQLETIFPLVASSVLIHLVASSVVNSEN